MWIQMHWYWIAVTMWDDWLVWVLANWMERTWAMLWERVLANWMDVVRCLEIHLGLETVRSTKRG